MSFRLPLFASRQISQSTSSDDFDRLEQTLDRDSKDTMIIEDENAVVLNRTPFRSFAAENPAPAEAKHSDRPTDGAVTAHRSARRFNCCTKIKMTANIVASAITPLAFAFNAFLAGAGMKASEFSIDAFINLPAEYITLAIICGASSEFINLLSNYDVIPLAFESLLQLRNHFCDHGLRNSLILLLTFGSSIAAAAIGYSSFEWAGHWIASLNAIANFFLNFVTRLYGLMNLALRLDKHMQQGEYVRYLTCLSHDRAMLNLIASEHTANIMLLSTSQIDQESVKELLSMTMSSLTANPNLTLSSKPKTERLIEFSNYFLAAMAAVVVTPIFAQKFVDGMAKVVQLMTSSDTDFISNLDIHVKQTLGIILGIATPFAYGNAVSLCIPALRDSLETWRAPATTRLKKIAFPVLVLLSILSGLSGYNLAKSVASSLNYIFRTITPVGSSMEIAIRFLAFAATFATNAPFVARTLLPAPPYQPRLSIESGESKEQDLSSTSQTLQAVTKGCVRWLAQSKNRLSTSEVNQLNIQRKNTDNIRNTFNAPTSRFSSLRGLFGSATPPRFAKISNDVELQEPTTAFSFSREFSSPS